MARVICELENASNSINGVAFSMDKGQLLSAEIPEHMAEIFLAIPGYKRVGPAPLPPLSAEEAAAKAAAAVEEERARNAAAIDSAVAAAVAKALAEERARVAGAPAGGATGKNKSSAAAE